MRQKRVVIVQARMRSRRLPGKTLLPVLGRPLLSFLLERLRRVRNKDQVVVATTLDPSDDAIAGVCREWETPFFRGSTDDVLERYLLAAKSSVADVVVRVTADCPLLDPRIVDRAINFFISGNFDYISNTAVMTYPRGMDVEVFSFVALERAAKEACWSYEREHVTPYFYLHPLKFRRGNLAYRQNLAHYRLTLDTREDFILIKAVLEGLYPRKRDFTFEDILDFLEKNRELSKINSGIKQKSLREFQCAYGDRTGFVR